MKLNRKKFCSKTGALSVAVAALWLVVPGSMRAQNAPAPSRYDQQLQKLGDGLKENMAIRDVHFEKTEDRKHKRFYTKEWDLSGLPEYKPSRQFTGTIRVSGNYLVAGAIADRWKKDFEALQPGVNVVMTQEGTVASGAVDIETGPRINDRLREASRFEQQKREAVTEIDWATGSYNVPGWSPGFVIFVQKDNPVAHLTLAQLDGIFGGAHSGGWDGTTWRPDSARGPEKTSARGASWG